MTSPLPPAGNHHRRDVQGLRAVAVLVVVAHHLWGLPHGGFVGVDVFFVISGFVITGLLLREQDREGTIRFRRFYARRVKRLLPAALTVLVVTVVVAHQVLGQARWRTTAEDAIAAAFFVGNWRFAEQQTDYFDANGPVSPVQHYWSLAVEEQFYLVWPVLLLVAMALARALSRRGLRVGVLPVLGAVVALALLASLAWAVAETASNPVLAYFSTLSRAWELGAGALVAVWARTAQPVPGAWAPVLGAGGLMGLALSLLVIDEASAFPAPWALLPVLSTAALLVAGHGRGEGRRGLLTHPVAVRLGDLSYSLYLWHFPVIVLAAELVDVRSVTGSVTALVVMAVLSTYSYLLVEDPIRKSSWLEPGPTGRRRPPQGSWWLTATSGLAAGAVAVVAVIALPLRPGGPSDADDLQPGVSASLGPAAGPSGSPAPGPRTRELAFAIDAALGARSWPDLSPSIDEVIEASFVEDEVLACSEPGPVPDGCAWGSPTAPRTAVLLGDSVAVSLLEAAQEVFSPSSGWRLQTFAMVGCPFTWQPTRTASPEIDAACPARKQEAVTAVRALRPDVVLVANRYGERFTPTAARWSPARWGESQQAALARITPHAEDVVVLTPHPGDLDLESCFTKVSRPADCVSRVDEEWLALAQQDAKAASRTGAVLVDTRPLFCDDRGLCPSFVGDLVVKADAAHVTPAYGRRAAPALEELMRRAGVPVSTHRGGRQRVLLSGARAVSGRDLV